MSVQLTHKLRNPKDLSKWLDIWTADVTEEGEGEQKVYPYTISPSSNWKIPITNLDFINSEGDSTKFLNQKGQWYDPNYNLTITNTNSNLKLSFKQDETEKNKINILYDNPIVITPDLTSVESPSLRFSLNKITNDNIADNAKIATSKLDSDAQNTISNIIINKNEETQEEICSINMDNASKVWTTDDAGNPGWRKVSNQFDTKLFGAYIGWHKPTTIIIEEESSEKKYTLSESIEDTDKEDIIKATLIGFYQYDKKYETMSVRLKGSFDITRWIIDGPAGGNESTEPSTGDDPAGAPSIEPYSNSFVIKNIESDSFPIQIEDKVLDLNWALDQWIGPEPNENYLIKNMTYYDNLMQYSSDEDKKDFMNGLCREFLTVISDNKNNQDASFSSLEDWKGKSGNTLIECLSDWDYNHCGIWIET